MLKFYGMGPDTILNGMAPNRRMRLTGGRQS